MGSLFSLEPGDYSGKGVSIPILQRGILTPRRLKDLPGSMALQLAASDAKHRRTLTCSQLLANSEKNLLCAGKWAEV